MKKSKFEKFGSKNTLNKDLLTNIKGKGGYEGWIPTYSGECNNSGRSCWDALKDLIGM